MNSNIFLRSFMKAFKFLISLCFIISLIKCTQSGFLKKTSRLSNPKISVNTYYIQPKTNSSVYLSTGSPYVYKMPPPLGQRVIISETPELFYVNIKEGLIRNYLNGTILETQTLAGGNTRPTIILLFKTPLSQEDAELSDPSWEFIRRRSRRKTYYSITKLVKNPITLVDEVWAFTYDPNDEYQNFRFELYNRDLETQKWRVY